MDEAWIKARIAGTKTRIETLETALASVSAGTMSSYTLDTGQNRVVVSRSNLVVLERSIAAAYNLLATLEARLYGAATQIRPGW